MNDRRKRDDTVRAVDLFCGAGGLSWGLAQACESLDRDVELAAVNHWERAIETHEVNHPWADHYHAKVEELDPRDVFDTERVDILTGGPQCTHHSNARGSRPVDEQKRASPWHVLDWLQKLYVDHFVIENVPEFRNWGPVGADGQPMKSKRGETFDAWINALHSLGYSVDWKILNSANYGDATARRRLFVVGRRQQQPEFPTPTHSEGGEDPGTEPWRSAAEIIDWSDPGKSIWERDRPLVNNTMQRIAEGIRRHGHEDLKAYADAIAELGKEDVEAMQESVVDGPDIERAVEERDGPFLARSAEGVESMGLCLPYLLRQQSGGVPSCADAPVPTIATKGAISKVEPRPFVLPRNGFHRGLHSNPAYDPDEQPLHTITAKNHDGHLVTPYLVPYYSERAGQAPRTHDIEDPLPTVTATGSQTYVANPFLVEYYGNGGAQPVDEPLPTVTTRDRFALVLPDQYPWGIDIRFRMLQPRELAAAMGFPDDVEFVGNKTETIEQIGNAVPVNLAQSLCEQLLLEGDPTLRSFTDSDPIEVAVDGGIDAGAQEADD
ncbi:DNA cytosine methyltransferase [Halalkalicoccus sp. NIPERK01]|uniref:DNA cytosine methyltransferase n=1 Tax=Halalkalicoccus sp. NIPERK01 TaxID=3053469 RepID=UPI00256F249D|nr:DNA cytosine methyltransferase [Halalkalicoccus sp. NIPERK01]MDL5361368.1 DNA cytosine methyltransferase [Halalkalicoccus sp. NIPERK01]